MGEFAQGVLADRRIQTPRRRLSNGYRTELGLQDSSISTAVSGMPSEPPDADPHVRWCGGRQGEPGAYPIHSHQIATMKA